MVLLVLKQSKDNSYLPWIKFTGTLYQQSLIRNNIFSVSIYNRKNLIQLIFIRIKKGVESQMYDGKVSQILRPTECNHHFQADKKEADIVARGQGPELYPAEAGIIAGLSIERCRHIDCMAPTGVLPKMIQEEKCPSFLLLCSPPPQRGLFATILEVTRLQICAGGCRSTEERYLNPIQRQH